jgi:hypothetical protein
MRTLIFGAALITVAAAGFHTLIAASLDAARDARPATFSERFAPVLKPVLYGLHLKKPRRIGATRRSISSAQEAMVGTHRAPDTVAIESGASLALSD